MVEIKVVSAGNAKLEIVPELGGGISRLDVHGKPVLRPWSGDESNLFSLASNILVPFSNRISGGGFEWNRMHYPLTPNMSNESFPIHGDGFQKVWENVEVDEGCRMILPNGTFGPWRYGAEQVLNLSPGSLQMTLTLINKGEIILPFGCGFHPWFPRYKDTKLSFVAETIWMEDTSHLPTKELPISEDSDWRFDQPRTLPEKLINNGYTGWCGTARIEQGRNAVSCSLTASKNLKTAIVYSPYSGSDFFCFEPVSHPVDAFHLPGRPGLVELAPGDSMIASMTISWKQE